MYLSKKVKIIKTIKKLTGNSIEIESLEKTVCKYLL